MGCVPVDCGGEMWGVGGVARVTTEMCASTWTSGRSDPNPEQVFGQAFETHTGLGFCCVRLRTGVSGRVSYFSFIERT